MKRIPLYKIALMGAGIVAGFAIINVIILDVLFVFKKSELPLPRTIVLKQEQPSVVNQASSVKDECPISCVKKIQEATASVKITQVPTPPITLTPTQAQTITPSSSGVKEFFIPVGSGNSTAADWTDVSGAQATVDSTQYPNIKSVVFEVSLRIPTGNETAYARLFNATDKHPVWFSEVSIDGGTPKLVFSQAITLDPGVKTYQVQMKTSLQYTAYIDQSRIHITIY